jgi:quercetin dioxygenase-like cupin family protein
VNVVRFAATAVLLSSALSCKSKGDVPAASSEGAAQPVVARFVDLTAQPAAMGANMCETAYVDVVRGTAQALGESLAAGDVLVVQGPDPFGVTGDGLAVFAVVVVPRCTPKARPVGPIKHVVRANAAPDLAWAGGAMHAHLDVEKGDVSREIYLGRLEGTAPVAEHAHESSWEIICAVDASGTFTLDGKSTRLGPRGVVVVPPNTKHSWTPDPGSRLVAVQLYDPPGPEQRFKKLAGVAPDG